MQLTRILSIAIVVLLAALWWQHAKIADLKLEAAQSKALLAERQARYTEALLQQEQEAFAKQQEIQNAYDLAVKESRRVAVVERTRVDRLRSNLVTATTAAPRDPIAATCDDTDRLEALGRLAAEGAGLLQEARELLREREDQLMALRAQVLADRDSAPTPSGPQTLLPPQVPIPVPVEGAPAQF